MPTIPIGFGPFELHGYQIFAKEKGDRLSFILNVKLLGVEISEAPTLRWGAQIKIVAEASRGPVAKDRPNHIEIKTVEYFGIKNVAIANAIDGNDLGRKAVGVKTGFDPTNRYVAILGKGQRARFTCKFVPFSFEEKLKAIDVPSESVQVSFVVTGIAKGTEGDKALRELANGKAVNLLKLPHEDIFGNSMVVSLFPSGAYNIRLDNFRPPDLYPLDVKDDREWSACFNYTDPGVPRPFSGLVSSHILVKWERSGGKESER